MTGGYILHLASAADFYQESESRQYLPPDFERDGFIHCTREPEVLLDVANQFYRHVPGDMVVLVIDPARLRSEVRYEAPAPPGPGAPAEAERLFPHIYGPLNREAIVEVRPAQRALDGRYLAV
jgi:uncharacterized protein (DUF952 family)